MFTGIVEHVAVIESLERAAEGGRLRVNLAGAAEILASLRPGSSLAVNGCCLTLVEVNGEIFQADLSSETLRRTSFAELRPGTRVNVERPLTAGKEFGGHFVQGHVDGVGRVMRLLPDGANWWLAVRVPAELGRYVAVKGSIAVDGISLTVATWQEGMAEMAIVPFTYAHTSLHTLTVGDPANIECDILAKYVEQLLQVKEKRVPSRLTVAELRRQGF